jgi:hypothetical protein
LIVLKKMERKHIYFLLFFELKGSSDKLWICRKSYRVALAQGELAESSDQTDVQHFIRSVDYRSRCNVLHNSPA